MIRPSKHSHPDQTIVYASAVILRHLASKRVAQYDSLRQVVLKLIPTGKVLFIPAVNLLYALGVITYHPKSDSFEYTPNASS